MSAVVGEARNAPRSTHEARARSALARAIRRLSPRCDAILARRPLIDPRTPETSDIDLLGVSEVEDVFPVRLVVADRTGPPVRVDLIWLPRKSLDDVAEFARNGLIAHRLLSSDVVYERDPHVGAQRARIGRRFVEPSIRIERIRGFLDMGFLTVREVGVTRDFPPLALFWLHMAHAACLAAILDAAGRTCPNVYTRPLDYLPLAEEVTGRDLEDEMAGALRLDAEPAGLEAPLGRIHRAVSQRFPEPTWPAAMRAMTRHEYRYFLAHDELEWRKTAAREMAAAGQGRGAVFYLRFWAYALARIPMVHQRALDGLDVSFVRPSRAVRPELERLCPEILEDLSEVLAGGRVGWEDVEAALEELARLRAITLEVLKERGLEPADLRPWRPHEGAVSHRRADGKT